MKTNVVHCSGEWSPELSAAEESTVFEIVHSSLAWCVAGGVGEYDYTPYTVTPTLERDTATFVTLHLAGQLRGCIGSLFTEEPLYQSLHQNAVKAAMRDPRFPPVSPEELPRLEVTISILSPITPIASLDDFHLGEHGIILYKDDAGAVFLPEVAIEQDWDTAETLTQLSLKAGLPPDAWQQDATFAIFSTAVLGRGDGES